MELDLAIFMWHFYVTILSLLSITQQQICTLLITTQAEDGIGFDRNAAAMRSVFNFLGFHIFAALCFLFCIILAPNPEKLLVGVTR